MTASLPIQKVLSTLSAKIPTTLKYICYRVLEWLPKVISFSGVGEDEACKDDEAGDAFASSMQADVAGRSHSQHETKRLLATALVSWTLF